MKKRNASRVTGLLALDVRQLKAPFVRIGSTVREEIRQEKQIVQLWIYYLQSMCGGGSLLCRWVSERGLGDEIDLGKLIT